MTTTTHISGTPLIHSDEFEIYSKNGEFGDYKEIANKLYTDGYATIDVFLKNPNAIDNANRELNTFFTTNDERETDSWSKYSSVKDIATSPPILKMLQVLYGRKPLPFQTLVFPKGTQQHFHSDSIHFSCFPKGFMCAVWVALENVHSDAGPLYYYPQSHKMPYIEAYQVGYRQTQGIIPEQDIFHNYWVSEVERRNYKKESFLAKKGQAFIWTANLLHGGSEILNQSLTRRSMVTHYYFDNCTYYTPLASDIPSGNLRIRQLPNIK